MLPLSLALLTESATASEQLEPEFKYFVADALLQYTRELVAALAALARRERVAPNNLPGARSEINDLICELSVRLTILLARPEGPITADEPRA